MGVLASYCGKYLLSLSLILLVIVIFFSSFSSSFKIMVQSNNSSDLAFSSVYRGTVLSAPSHCIPIDRLHMEFGLRSSQQHNYLAHFGSTDQGEREGGMVLVSVRPEQAAGGRGTSVDQHARILSVV